MSKVAILGSRNVPIPPVRGGAIEHWIVNVTKLLTQHEFLIFSPADPALADREKKGNIEFQRIQENPLYARVADALRWDPFSYLHRAAARMKEFKPDIVHLFNVPLGVEIVRKALPGARVILHCMNTWDQIGKRSRGALNGGPGPDLFVACSEFLADAERGRMALHAADLKVITNGADVNLYQPWWTHPARDSIRRTLDIADRKVILFSGRLTGKKGIDRLVAALPAVVQAVPEALLVILGASGFGRGGAKETGYLRNLREACAALEKQVKFLGFIAPGEIHEYYAAADAFCHPVRWEEPFSLAVCEAAATGLPIVATHTGGTPELITDGKTGRLVPADAGPETLAKALMDVLSNPERARAFGEEARRRVEARHNWQAIAARTDDVYGELLRA